MFYEHHGLLVSELILGFTWSAFLQEFKSGFGVLDSILSLSQLLTAIQDLEIQFHGLKSGKFYGVGVSQLPACSAW